MISMQPRMTMPATTVWKRFRQTLRSPSLPMLLILSALLMGCATPRKRDVATPFTLTLDVSASVNPDSLGRPAPILVGVYDLKTSAAFSSAGFASLQDHAKASLGDDLVAFEQMILRPGEQRTIEWPVNAQTHALGIVAGYRELDRSVWRTVVALPVATDEPRRFSLWPVEPPRLVLRATLGERGIVVNTTNRNTP